MCKPIILSNFSTLFPYKGLALDDECFFSIDPKKKRKMSRGGIIALAVATITIDQFVESDKISKANYKDMGIIFSTCYGALDEMHQGVYKYQSSKQVSPVFLPKILVNMPSSNISIEKGLTGISYSIVCGDESFLIALIEAIEIVQDNPSKCIVVVASESCVGTFSKKVASNTTDISKCILEGGGAVIVRSYSENDILDDNDCFLTEHSIRLRQHPYPSDVKTKSPDGQNRCIGCLNSVYDLFSSIKQMASDGCHCIDLYFCCSEHDISIKLEREYSDASS